MWQQLLCLVLSSCSHTDTDVLRGRDVHVTSFVAPPYLIRRPESAAATAGTSGGYEGFMVDLLDALAAILGCRFIIREVADGRYGMPKEGVAAGNDGMLWTGMIGEVMRGEADLAVADLTATAARSLVVDFSQPILDNQLVAVANRWLSPSVQSLAELINRDEVTFLVVQGGSTSKFFQLTADPVYGNVRNRIRYVNSTKEGLEMVAANPDHVSLLESTQAEYNVKRDCRLRIAGEPFNSASYAMAMAKGGALRVGDRTYDYLTLVNWALLKLKYSGEVARIQQKWWTPPATNPCTS